MQATSMRSSAVDHSGPFERRFNPHLNGDSLDSHPTANGQYGSSFTGGGGGGSGAGTGAGGFDRGHSPRTHSVNSGTGMLHSSTPKEAESVILDQSQEVPMIDDSNGFADKSNYHPTVSLVIF